MWEIDSNRRELRAHGRPVPIGSRAFEIVEKLAQSAGQFVSKDELVAHVWRGTSVEENTLRVHIHAIRRALGSDRALLKTFAGRGYRLVGHWTSRPQTYAAVTSIVPTATPDESPRNRLPAAIADIIGRNASLRQLQDLVSAFRIVTLTGPGGIGKTTLAVELARTLTSEFDGRVCFVELASLADPSLVAATVATAVGAESERRAITPEEVARSIGTRKLLLVLDNCEHVIDTAVGLCEAILQYCPQVSVLATSREVMRIEGERVYRVPPLDLPASADEGREQLLQSSAVELFVARTQALDDRFVATTANLGTVAAICRNLDGIPLAIEFAAARTATLGVHQVAISLRDRFSLLASRRRMALPRHQTLRATFDWSYELLTPEEQALLARVAIFVGGFTLDAATAVAGAKVGSAILDALDGLVAKSLVILDETGATSRWRLLSTIRAYAREKLGQDSEADQVTSARHAAFFRDYFTDSTFGESLSLGSESMASYLKEIDNVRAALDWCFSASGDMAVGIKLTAAYTPAWLQLALFAECRQRCERALDNLEAVTALDRRLELRLWMAHTNALVLTMGPSDLAQSSGARALAIAEALGDWDKQAQTLYLLVGVYTYRGEHGKAREITEQFHRVAQRTGNSGTLASAERMMGIMALNAGRLPDARHHLERVVQSSVKREDYRLSGVFRSDDRVLARAMLGQVLCLQGFVEQAFEQAQAALGELQPDDHQSSHVRALYYGMCRIALTLGDLETADRTIRQLTEAAARSNLGFWIAAGQLLEGRRFVARGDHRNGVALLREGFAICDSAGWRVSYLEYKGALAQGLAGLGYFDDAFAVLDEGIASAGVSGSGQVWYLPELFRLKAEMLIQRGLPDSAAIAAGLFTRATELARQIGALLWELRIALSQAQLKSSLGQPEEAKALVAAVYGRFTEGFDRADIREARALLEDA